MSILDSIDSGDMLSTLLGLNTRTAVSTNGGEGSPLSPDDLPQPSPGYTISTAGRQPGMPAPKQAPQNSAPPMPPADYMGGVGPAVGDGMTAPAPALPQASSMDEAGMIAPPPTGQPGGIGSDRSNTAWQTAPAAPQPGGIGSDKSNDPWQTATNDMSARSAPPQVHGVPVAPAATPQRQDPLFTQLSGLQPAAPDKWGQFASGVGKGLSAVGALRRGASAGQAFSAGAGGGLTGSYEAGQKEHEEFFKNTIAADSQVMKGKKFPHDIAHEDASTNYLNSGVQQRLQNAALGPMGKVYGSWLQSDIGRLKLADSAFDAQEKRNIQYLQEKNKAGVDTTKDWEKMEATREQRKAGVYKQYGITDPTNFKGSQKNPIDASTMTPEQMERAPEGTYFRFTGKDGKTVVAPRDYNSHPNRWATQAAGTGGYSDYAATQAALAGGGAQ